VSTRPALVLTGPPAVGKSSTAHAVAATRLRCAVVDVDDIRQLVVSGHAAPWEGAEGVRQQALGVRNACALAVGLLAEGIDVVLADVLTPRTAEIYRVLLPGCLVVRLTAPLSVTRRRAASRPAWLTPDELDALHAADAAAPPAVDVTLDVAGLTLRQQVDEVCRTWVAGAT
jgi:hypothetical protein